MMLIGRFNEWPYQDPKFMGKVPPMDLTYSNGDYDSVLAANLFDRWIEEIQYAEEVGFDAFMLNEHHSAPFCMQSVTNVGAAILSRMTTRAKICILGNVIPLWDDPLWLAETLAMIDVLSHGRLASGWVRGSGRESLTHNVNPVYNRERLDEAHDFVIKTWTTPGPFRWEGKHFQYRYVNPWAVPLQKPHPQIWIPTTVSAETVEWAARHRSVMVMTATLLGPTKAAFDYYEKLAKEYGYEAGPQNRGYNWKVHVDETEEKAEAVARKFLTGTSNPFILGNEGIVNRNAQELPGIVTRRSRQMETAAFGPRGRGGTTRRTFEEQTADYQISYGTPKTILPKIRHVLEYLRPGTVMLWTGDGSMTHEEQMRSLRLMGQEVIPAMKEMAKELGLVSSFEVNDGTGFSLKVQAGHQ